MVPRAQSVSVIQNDNIQYASSLSFSKIAQPREEDLNIRMHIIDARSKFAAQCNFARGGGYEERYPNCSIHFMAVGNVHEVRKTYRNLIKQIHLINVPSINIFGGWLGHIKTLLDAINRIASFIDNGKSVLVHCSDGWDRTPQIVSLAQLLLDPYFRTIAGFGMLIQKEWLQFGHKFMDRIGYGESEDATNFQSPIFQQFLDCVYQILRQYPEAFEFTEQYLLTILDEIFSSRFGTFLLNTESERERNRLHTQTLSLWPWLLQPEQIQTYLNPHYISHRQPIVLSTCDPKVWMGFYSRYKPSLLNLSNQSPVSFQESSSLDQSVALCEKTLHEHRLISRTFDLDVKNYEEDEEIVTLNELLSFTEQPIVTRHVRDLSKRLLFEDYIPSRYVPIKVSL